MNKYTHILESLVINPATNAPSLDELYEKLPRAFSLLRVELFNSWISTSPKKVTWYDELNLFLCFLAAMSDKDLEECFPEYSVFKIFPASLMGLTLGLID